MSVSCNAICTNDRVYRRLHLDTASLRTLQVHAAACESPSTRQWHSRCVLIGAVTMYSSVLIRQRQRRQRVQRQRIGQRRPSTDSRHWGTPFLLSAQRWKRARHTPQGAWQQTMRRLIAVRSQQAASADRRRKAAEGCRFSIPIALPSPGSGWTFHSPLTSSGTTLLETSR